MPMEISARSFKGSSVAPAAGYIGEKIDSISSSLFNQAIPVSGTWYDDSHLSLTLQPGIYRLEFSSAIQAVCSATSAGYSGIDVAIRSGVSTLVKNAAMVMFVGKINDSTYPTPSNVAVWCNICVPQIIVTTATTYKVSIVQTVTGGSCTIDNVYIRGDVRSSTKSLIATRIA